MALGPVQMLVLGFAEPNFTGKIAAELDRLRQHEFVKIVDALVVQKDDAGEITALEVSDLSQDEAIEMGAIAGALIGFGYGGRRGRGRSRSGVGGRGDGGRPPDPRGGRLVRRRRDPERIGGGDHPARAPVGDPAPRRDRRCRWDCARRRVDPRARSDRGRRCGGGNVQTQREGRREPGSSGAGASPVTQASEPDR